jgi:hypothetical protein
MALKRAESLSGRNSSLQQTQAKLKTVLELMAEGAQSLASSLT